MTAMIPIKAIVPLECVCACVCRPGMSPGLKKGPNVFLSRIQR